MDTNKLVEHLLTSRLIKNDFLTATVFFYLAGRFPDLTIAQCADAVEIIRDRLISNR